ncbi:MAG: hypothetical protein ABID54_02825 [Pseudomonadota bacterium]
MRDDFHKNLHTLRERYPVLAHRFADLAPKFTWEIYPTSDGLRTAKKILGEGQFRYIHSRVSPKKEAEKWTGLLGSAAETVVVSGFGLGYHLLGLHGSYPRSSLVIIEVDLELFQLALKLANLTPILRDPKVHLLIGEDIPVIEEFLKSLSPTSITYREFLPSTDLHPEYYRSVRKIAENCILRHRLRKDREFSRGIMRLLDETKA